MSEEMAEEGYTNILNIDTSEAAINFMQDRHSQQERPPTIKCINTIYIYIVRWSDGCPENVNRR